MLWFLLAITVIAAGALVWFLRTQGSADEVAQGSAEPRAERQDGRRRS